MPSPASLLPAAEAVQGRKPEHWVRIGDAGAGAGTGEDPGQHQLGEGEHGDGAGLVPARGRLQLTLRPRPLRTLLPARPRGRLASDGLQGLSPEPPAPWPGQTLTHSSAPLTPSAPAPSPKHSLLAAPVPPWASPAGSLAAPEGQGPLPAGRAWRLYDGQWGGGRGALGWWGGPAALRCPGRRWARARPGGVNKGLHDSLHRGPGCWGARGGGTPWGAAPGIGQEAPGTLRWAGGGGRGCRAPRAVRSLVLSGSGGSADASPPAPPSDGCVRALPLRPRACAGGCRARSPRGRGASAPSRSGVWARGDRGHPGLPWQEGVLAAGPSGGDPRGLPGSPKGRSWTV